MASDLGLHCLPISLLGVSRLQLIRGLICQLFFVVFVYCFTVLNVVSVFMVF